MTAPLLTAVVCTWNRARLLEGALEALVRQDAPPPHEIIVVDNNSPDDTAHVVARAAARHSGVRYVREPRQGLAHARNAAIDCARGELLAFVDDDVRAAPDWMACVADAFERWPSAGCVGGPVAPHWSAPPPPWLTPEQWPPLGVQDYGPDPFRVDHGRPVCLIGANLAFRRSAIRSIGSFSSDVQRVGEGGGSTEDHEFHLRLWNAGLHGMYDPRVRVAAVVLPERLRKAHHRAWHFDHGRHMARMRVPELEATRAGRVFGVPAHLLRQAAHDAWDCAAALLSGNTARAFQREVRLWFVAGFLRERWV